MSFNAMEAQRRSDRQELLHGILMGNKALIIVIFLGTVLAFSSPVFLRTSNLLNICRQVCVSALLSVGFTMILSSGHMDLSVGTLMGLCGMILGKMLDAGQSIAASILACIACGIVGGALNAGLITALNLPPFVVTLATQSIFKGVNFIISNLLPVTITNRSFMFIGQGYVYGVPFPVYVMFAVVLLVWIMMNKTRYGRHVLAVGGNADAARVSGINVNLIRFCVYMGSGVCIGIAAVVMTSRVAAAQTGAGVGMEMSAIAAVVIGGTSMRGGNANVLGTLFGCLIVGIVSNGLNLLSIDTNWQVIAQGVMILIAVGIDVLSSRAYAARLSRYASMMLQAQTDPKRAF